MNATALTKQYGKLTPLERLPLILAASFRGDEAESERLTQSAPRVYYKAPHHSAVGLTFREVAHWHHQELLATAVGFWGAYGFSLSEKRPGHFSKLFPLHACKFKVLWEAWREFCRTLSIDPDRYSEMLPGWHALRSTAEVAELVAAAPDEVERLMQHETDNATIHRFSVEHEARALRDFFDTQVAYWQK